jgi:hypothetical protein
MPREANRGAFMFGPPGSDGCWERRSPVMRKVKLLFLVLVALMAFAAPAVSD